MSPSHRSLWIWKSEQWKTADLERNLGLEEKLHLKMICHFLTAPPGILLYRNSAIFFVCFIILKFHISIQKYRILWFVLCLLGLDFHIFSFKFIHFLRSHNIMCYVECQNIYSFSLPWFYWDPNKELNQYFKFELLCVNLRLSQLPILQYFFAAKNLVCQCTKKQLELRMICASVGGKSLLILIVLYTIS